MKHRILTAVVVIPLFIVVSTTPGSRRFRINPGGHPHPAGHDDLQSGNPNLQRHHGEDHF